MRKIPMMLIADRRRNILYLVLGIQQHFLGMFDANVGQIIDKPTADRLVEQAAEIRRIQIHDTRHLL